jgi:hypothetical protein
MHLYFHHWHKRVELKPESAVLQIRWDAAAKFSEGLSRGDACSLLRLSLFGTVEPEFAKRLSDALVAAEPTFPPEENLELLRVMATAAIYSQMETESSEADAVALGILAAAFPPDRINPVCKELAQRADEYLAVESERMRPTPNVESDYKSLKKATEDEAWADSPEATKLVGNAILELGETMGRIAEENQYLWWLLGQRSSLLNTRREKLSSKEYALLAGAEAAERVALLPPPSSVESLIDEVLSQCAKATNTAVPLAGIIDAANIGSLSALTVGAEVGELCPLQGLVSVRRAGGKVDGASLEKLSIPAKLKVSPTKAANQYFRELMFLRALAQLG